MIDTEATTQVVCDIAKKNFSHEFGKPEIEITAKETWQKLRNIGTRLWLDTGDFDFAKKLWCSEFDALTTNNTLLNREVQKGIYDEFIRFSSAKIQKALPEINEHQLLLDIGFVLNAHHALRLVKLFDAHVSVELHTDFGNDIGRTVEYADRYYSICPERFYIKVPFSATGLLAARKIGKMRIPVNFTLGFSARQNYAAALLAQPEYVNVFMGRLNSFVIDNNLGNGLNIGEKATLATQRQILSLRKMHKTQSLLIGASIRQPLQVPALAGVDVLTMPPKVAEQYEQEPAEQIESQVQRDLPITFFNGITADDFNGETLWSIPDAFKDCVHRLEEKDLDILTPQELQEHFAEAGFGNFLPQWSQRDIETVSADGKIPVYNKWKQRLESRQIGMDALMNISAFYSFATDQRALDRRIKSLL